MIRQIIKIDKEKCNGCGMCVTACHEGAIELIDGKAELVREHFCDGLGDCLPNCPTNAITFEKRDVPAYDQEAVNAAKNSLHQCPGSKPHQINTIKDTMMQSKLSNWPVQIKLAPINAPYFNDANLLIAADCCSYSYASFHHDFMAGKVTLIGCPKLDGIDYSQKLTEIIKNNNIKSITVVRMEVPCCGGIEFATIKAINNSKKMIPCQVVTISIEGNIIE